MDSALSRSGDLALDDRGLPYLISDTDETAQQLYILLSARRGRFLYDRRLGSRLSEETPLTIHQAEALAREALILLPGAEVLSAELSGGELLVRISYEGQHYEIIVKR